MAGTHIKVNAEHIHHDGSLFIDVYDNKGRLVSVTRFAVLKIGVNATEVIEVRTETSHGISEQKVVVDRP